MVSKSELQNPNSEVLHVCDESAKSTSLSARVLLQSTLTMHVYLRLGSTNYSVNMTYLVSNSEVRARVSLILYSRKVLQSSVRMTKKASEEKAEFSLAKTKRYFPVVPRPPSETLIQTVRLLTFHSTSGQVLGRNSQFSAAKIKNASQPNTRN